MRSKVLLVEEEQNNTISNNGKGKEAMTEEIITIHQSRWSIENIENILKARFRGNRQWEFWRI